MNVLFYLIAGLTLLGAAGAMCLRNLVHCALSAVVAFGGLAALYLRLHAQFAGFAQILVYVGAVAILIIFAVLLTRGGQRTGPGGETVSSTTGMAIALLVSAAIIAAVCSSALVSPAQVPASDVPARALGQALLTQYVLPLEVIGILLTVALMGAVLVAMRPPGVAQQAPAVEPFRKP